MKIIFLILSLLLFVAPGYAGETTKWTSQPGGVYKWKDQKGQVHYTQYPPAGVESEKVEEVEPSYPTQLGAPQATDQSSAIAATPGDQAGAEPTDQLSKERELMQKNCITAKQNLVLLQSKAANLTYVDDEGNVVKVDDKERAARIEAAKKNAVEFCK